MYTQWNHLGGLFFVCAASALTGWACSDSSDGVPPDPCGPNHGGCDPVVTCDAPSVCGNCPATYRRQNGRCQPILSEQFDRVTLQSGDVFRFYANWPVENGPWPRVTQLVVSLHGSGRNAGDYHSRMFEAAARSRAQGETLIVSPDYKADTDNTVSRELRWADSATWRDGRRSTSGVSSFLAMDELLLSLVNSGQYPNLQRIVLAGHGAGGQFIQRYAMMNRLEPGLPGFRFLYLPTNPASYAYLDDRRPAAGGTFAVPGGTCNAFNEWKYGLGTLPPGYVSDTGADTARLQYGQRDVVYVLGSNNTGSMGLDATCMAKAQGDNRLLRGENYFRYVSEYYGRRTHRVENVAGVGHSASNMFQSETMRSLLFTP